MKSAALNWLYHFSSQPLIPSHFILCSCARNKAEYIPNSSHHNSRSPKSQLLIPNHHPNPRTASTASPP
jgi:hypothetical protein